MISLINVTKEYRLDPATNITPIREVNLEIQRHDFLMIVGRSGSGKTTLLNLCGGLIKPTSGQVLVDGADIQKLSDKKLSILRSRKIGFIFQFQSLLPNLNILENVAMPAAASGKATHNLFQRATELLVMVDLGERTKVYPKQLSAGELRRVAIARALINQPEILLADEPTADLDENTEVSIVSLLQKIHQSGVTVVMITHSLDLIPYSTRAFKVENGGLTPINRDEYTARRKNTESLATSVDAPAAECERPVLSTDTKIQASPQTSTTTIGRRLNFGPIIIGLAIIGLISGLVALSLELAGTNNIPQTQPPANPPVLQTRLTTSAGGSGANTSPANPELIFLSLDNLATLQQYELLAVNFSALMAFDFLGTPSSIGDFPANLNIPLVPIKWSGTLFNGELIEDAPGANFTYSIDGVVSADGTKLLSLVVSSRQALPESSDEGIIYRVTLQNLPLVDLLRKTDSGLGIFVKSGSGLLANIAKLEYIDGPLRYIQTSPLSTGNTANLADSSTIPALKLTFGRSGASLDKVSSH
jgi:putative ABC transport system ATP-binding protein